MAHSLLLVLFLLGWDASRAALVESAAPPPSAGAGQQTRRCDHYSAECVANATCGPRDCTEIEPDKTNHCFTLWVYDNASDAYTIRYKDCFIATSPCENGSHCKRRNGEILFCCCEGDMCNSNSTFPGLPPATEAPTERPPVEVSETLAPDDTQLSVLLYSLAATFVLAVALIGCYLLYRHRKSNLFNELPTVEPSLSCPPSPAADDAVLPVTLLEVRARGRFGAVWRAHLHSREVAVKVFPLQDKQSWLSEQEIYQLPRMNHADILHYIGVDKKGDNLQSEYWLITACCVAQVAVKVFPLQDKQSWLSEQEIYQLPRMNHADILHYIGVDKKGDNLQSEYWLITAYHEKGSLCDYLKAHTLTWWEACRVTVSMARGLTHLHEETAAGAGGGYKPAVAHRDFKSKNVLLKSDMTACIADFGLALVFQPGKSCGDTHGQVGTRRYMAPEVLEGAINFTKDAFLRIDMYACGLVLWEIVSRCIERSERMGEYALPFEEEVGSHPSLEEMQDAVVLRKMRPLIAPQWRNHPGLGVLCDTMEECWDHDAEARLSASCVLERVATNAHNNNATPLLIEDAALLPPKDMSH